MRISDWSSDVCSSDLPRPMPREAPVTSAVRPARRMSVILFSLFHQFIVDFVGAAAGGVAPLRCRLAVEDAAVRIEDRDRRGALNLETKAFRYLGMANEIDVRDRKSTRLNSSH